MNEKWFRAAVSLLLLIMLMPMQAFAVEAATAEIPFTIENASGTVVIEAIDDAPLPEKTEFADVTEGTFALAYGDPGDYVYKIYQKPGTEPDVTYDETVYNVVVSVFVDEDDESLYTVVTISVAGNPSKPESVVFTNILPETENPSGNPNTPPTGDETHLPLWTVLAAISLAGVLCIVPAVRRKRDAHVDN